MNHPHDISRWANRAACIGSTDHLMPENVMKARHVSRRIPPKHVGAIEQARIVCRACPVLAECMAWVLGPEDPVPHHVAAGMTPFERSAKRRERYQARAVGVVPRRPSSQRRDDLLPGYVAEVHAAEPAPPPPPTPKVLPTPDIDLARYDGPHGRHGPKGCPCTECDDWRIVNREASAAYRERHAAVVKARNAAYRARKRAVRQGMAA